MKSQKIEININFYDKTQEILDETIQYFEMDSQEWPNIINKCLNRYFRKPEKYKNAQKASETKGIQKSIRIENFHNINLNRKAAELKTDKTELINRIIQTILQEHLNA